ncbi:hypothetical protein [Nonomuraea guangzhouensis]|uniref:Uncharacterized protein n=1 Tax=Nonomuraea guangzhouensis TaxID=1291555 RepID=A0ABW4GG35_9ACTN|nr:hypothetical protein [Nonomuraea guangzhouensis]
MVGDRDEDHAQVQIGYSGMEGAQTWPTSSVAIDAIASVHVKVAVLAGSLTAALLATVILRLRNRTYRRIHELETTDRDHDGIPDVYETDGHKTTDH